MECEAKYFGLISTSPPEWSDIHSGYAHRSTSDCLKVVHKTILNVQTWSNINSSDTPVIVKLQILYIKKMTKFLSNQGKLSMIVNEINRKVYIMHACKKFLRNFVANSQCRQELFEAQGQNCKLRLPASQRSREFFRSHPLILA